jgi:hypothetical protein
MKIVFPIRLDRPVYRKGQLDVPTRFLASTDDFDFVDVGGVSLQVSGWDASHENSGQGTRLTNLSAVHRGELMKVCAGCDLPKRHADYGEHGRTIRNYRDHSDCTDCRSRCA